MPKVTMLYDPTEIRFTEAELHRLGRLTQVLVAELASTEEMELNALLHVDFIPQKYPEGTLVAIPVAFEIEAIGYPARKKRITSEKLFTLKGKLINELDRAEGCPSSALNVELPLIWMKYIDPDGLHV